MTLLQSVPLGILHLRVSESPALRLDPVGAALTALDAPQAVVGGEYVPGAPPPTELASAGAAAVEAAISRRRPSVALVAGDGDEAVAGALVAMRLGVPIARLGAGLRCGDRAEAGEVNRLVLDELATWLFADGEPAVAQLRSEGVEEQRIHCVGSTVADAVAHWLVPARERAVAASLGLTQGDFVLVALRGVCDELRLERIAQAAAALAHRRAVVVCPSRAVREAMKLAGTLAQLEAAGVVVAHPLGYLDFLSLEAAAGAVVTDSADVQEETTVLGVPCFTLARTSERALTLTHGTNVLVGDDPACLVDAACDLRIDEPEPIPLWDGQAGRRIAATLAEAPA